MLSRIPVQVRVLVVFALLSLLYDSACFRAWLADFKTNGLLDFRGMWSYGRLITAGHWRDLYDDGTVRRFQHGLFPNMHGGLPFFYPPPAMFLLAPLGLLPAPMAWLLWTGAGLMAFSLAAVWRSGMGPFGLLVLLLPATLVEILFGQTGLFTSALLLGGLRLVPHRPVLAGMLLGLLCIKPQMGMLLPVALLAAGRERTLLVTTATAAAACVASGLAFGWEEWVAWVHALPLADGQWHTDAWHQSQFAPTFTASLAAVHTPWPLIRAVQVSLLAGSAAIMWREARRKWDRRTVVVICACFFLATPHGFIYDMPALCAALVLFATGGSLTRTEPFAILLTQMVPIFATWGHALFVLPTIILFLVGNLVLRDRLPAVIRRRRLPAPPTAPDVLPA